MTEDMLRSIEELGLEPLLKFLVDNSIKGLVVVAAVADGETFRDRFAVEAITDFEEVPILGIYPPEDVETDHSKLRYANRSQDLVVGWYCHRTKKKVVLKVDVGGQIEHWLTTESCNP